MPDHISTNPSSKYCVPSWAYNPSLGTRAYTADFSSYKQLLNESQHSDLALDKNGKDVYVASDYGSGDVAMVCLKTGARTDLFCLYGSNG